MKKIVYYLRNSTDQQDYEYQLNNLNTYIANFNNIELIHVYAEKQSGFSLENEREEMKLMLKSVSRGEIDEIWVNEITRLSRNAINLQQIVNFCAEYKVNIFFKNQTLNTLDDSKNFNPITRLIISILAQFAQMDAESLFAKLKQGKTSKAKLGIYVGGTLPLGYTYIDNKTDKTKKIIIDIKQKKVVEYVFMAYGKDGKTLARICNELNNLKLINPDFETVMKLKNKGQNSEKWKFHSWTPTTLKRIINCTWYAEGYRMWKGEKFILNEALKFIDLDLYNLANDLLKVNQHGRQEKVHTYLIKHLLYCSCGEKMNPKNSGKRYNYQCNLKVINDYNKQIKCTVGKSIQIEKLENTLWLLIKNKLPEFKSKVENKVNKEINVKSKVANNNELINAIETITIQDLKIYRKRTIDVYTKHGGDASDFDTKINEIDKQIRAQNIIKSELESENERLKSSLLEQDIVAEIEYKINRIENDKTQIKFYIKKLVKKIVACGGLKNLFINVVEIIWSENVNNNASTFLFYNSKDLINPKYYFISSFDEITQIDWLSETRTFKISNNESGEFIELDYFQITQKIENISDEKNRFVRAKNKFFMNELIDGKFNLNIGSDIIRIVSPFS